MSTFGKCIVSRCTKVSKDRQKEWQSAMTRYLISRSSLRGLMLVMDIRHPLTDSDWTLIELQQQGQTALHIILTKAEDKGEF